MNKTAARKIMISVALAATLTPFTTLGAQSASAAPHTTVVSNHNTSVQSAGWGTQSVSKANQKRIQTLNTIASNDKKIASEKAQLKKLISYGNKQATAVKKLKAQKLSVEKQILKQQMTYTRQDNALKNHLSKMNSQKQELYGLADTASKLGVNLDGFVGMIASTDPQSAMFVKEKENTASTIKQMQSQKTSTVKTLNATAASLQKNNANRTSTNSSINSLTATQASLKANIPSELSVESVRALSMTVPTFNSVKAVDDYVATLAAAGVSPIPASVLDDPNQWSAGLLPVPASNGRWNYGVAQVKTGENSSILVVSKETIYALRTGLQQVGVPYSWGGTTPNGFDCSGLMLYMFNSQDVSLPRTAAEQQDASVNVSKENLLPGDTVYYGASAHHVAIYVGKDANGKPLMLEAPRTGLDVRVTSLRDYTSANRHTI